MKRFLFIGHDAGRTGAPIVLLHFLRWARDHNPEWKIDLLLLRGGELEEEYRKVADVFVIPVSPTPSIPVRSVNFLKKKTGLGQKQRVPDLDPFFCRYDAVIANTVVSLEHLEFFKRKNIPTLCWIHELEYVVRSFYTLERFKEISEFADQFIVPAKAVERFLKDYGVDKKTHLVYEFSGTDAIASPTIPGAARESLGIPANAFIVLGCGTVEWRKGVDFFLQIAARVTSKNAEIYFVWIGGKPSDADIEFDRIQFDIKKLCLPDRVIITGFLKEPQQLFAEANIFALTSREDPFPLVCLAAASAGKPIFCFESSGGIPEFVEDDAGAVIPYGDIEAYADRILEFYANRPRLEAAGNAAMQKLVSRFSPDSSLEKFRDILLNL